MMLQSTRRKRLFSILFASAFLLFLGLQAAPARAGTITYFDVQLGSWNGSSFTADGSKWNTGYYGPNWAIGATDPVPGYPLLNSEPGGYYRLAPGDYSTVNLPPGNYWLYMASNDDTSATAIELTLGFSDNTSITEVFTTGSGGSPQFYGDYTLVRGSGFDLSFVNPPQYGYAPAGSGGYNQCYNYNGSPDWVVDFNTSEPSTAILLPIGLLALAFLGRKRLGLAL
jgi:hypothetical protein